MAAISPNSGEDKTEVRSLGHEGFAEGAMELKAKTVALHGLDFRNGTIEFGMKALGQDIPGIQFGRQGSVEKENAGEFDVRTFPECRARTIASSRPRFVTASCCGTFILNTKHTP